MIGQTISHYKITEKLGEGGMGEVYLAEDTSLKRKVALKFLPDYLQQDEVAQKRFLREAQSAAALDHPFICKIFETGEAEGQNFIAMEYVKGQTLKEKLLEGLVPLKQTLQIGMEIAEALEEAHKAGIAHRDLKPANIMLTSGGHVKVMDFGLAKKVVDEDGTEQEITSALTREGTTLGTLAYMSPEQLRGRTVDTRTDIFSFGIVLYELLAGVHPFRRPKQVETTNAILSNDPSPLSRYTEDTADLLQHTVEKMLEKNPDDRYQTVHEVRSNLKKLSEKLSAPDVAPSSVKVKRSIWLGAVAVIVVLVAIVLVVYLYQPSPTSVEEAPIDSIAILPFENITGDEKIEYLSEGIPASISSSLSKILQLRIKPSSVLRRYREQEVDPQVVAEEQGVRAVVMGKFNLIGDTLSVSVELVDATKDHLLWGEQYNTALADLVDLQREVAGRITAELRLQLTSHEMQQMDRRYTANPLAHEAYLKGLFYFDRIETEPIERYRLAAGFFNKAIDEDPEYVLPYVSLSQAHSMLGSQLLSAEHYRKAKEAAQRALQIDDSSAEAHLAMGHVLASDRDWRGAGVEFEQALDSDPNCQDRTGSYANYLLFMGRREEAVTELERLSRLSDPLSAFQQDFLGDRYYYAGEFDRALQIGRRFDIDWLILQCYLAKGMYQEAFDMLLEGQRATGASEEIIENYEAVYRESGIRGVLRLGMDEYLEGVVTPYDLARRYAFTGDKDEAFRWLNEAYELPYFVAFVSDHPRFDSLRDDARYEKLLRETLKLPEDAIAKHLAAR